MTIFETRSTQDELMDTEVVDYPDFRDCLADLASVNRLTLAYRPTLAFFERLLPRLRSAERAVRVVDVGSGYGDTLRRIHDWARARGVELELTGVDLNPWSARAAREASSTDEIEWVTSDVFDFDPDQVDIVVSALFTHHLRDPLLRRFIRWMEVSATIGWCINDLHRHPVPYHVFSRFSQLAGYHRFVQHDGPVSILRAFDRDDWRRLLTEAEVPIDEVGIQWFFPFRWSVERTRP